VHLETKQLAQTCFKMSLQVAFS